MRKVVRRVSRVCAGVAHTCLLLTVPVIAGLALACGPTPKYELTLRIENGAMLRTVARLPDEGTRTAAAAEADKGGFDAAQTAELSRLYGGKPAPDGRFTGRFEGVLPADLGGSGSLERHGTPLGTVYTYRERMQGKDSPLDFVQQLERARATAEALTQGWTPADVLGNPAAESAFAAWLHERVLPDLASFTFYVWLAGSTSMDDTESEQRVTQFLLDRGYYEVRDLESGPQVGVGVLLRRMLEKRGVAIDAALAARLDAMKDEDDLILSFVRHVARSQEFRTWQQTRTPVPDEKPVPEGAVEALLRAEESPEAEAGADLVATFLRDQHPELMDFISLAFLQPTKGLVDVTLALGEPPLATNGSWQADAGQVRWSDVEMRESPHLSALLYAIWAAPAAEYQSKHFGRTILSGERLQHYQEWRASLDAEQRRTWDKQVDGLRPGEELRARISALQLPLPKAVAETTDIAVNAAQPAVTLLLEGLDASAPPPDPVP